MNQILSIIKGRRSIREFLEKDIPRESIQEIMEAGRYAPSALNKQPCKFVIVTDKNCIARLSSLVKRKTSKIAKYIGILKLFSTPLRDSQIAGAIKRTVSENTDTVFYDAPLLILTVSDKREFYAGKDCLLAAQNMMLYARSLGIGSCFIGRADFLNMSKEAKEILNLSPRHVIHSAVVFGYPKQIEEKKTPPERKKDNIINWID